VHVLILSLDTSSPSGSVAILRDEITLGVISTRAEENYSSRIFRHLEFLLSDLTMKLEEFDLFAVSSGPGSFTGLRVGLTAAKGWAEVYRKPVVGVSALEAVAFQAGAAGPALVPALDARRGQIYFGIYRIMATGLVLDGGEFVVRPEEFAEQLSTLAHSGNGDERGNRAGALSIVTPDASVAADVSRLMANFPADLARLEIVSSVLAPFIGRIAHARALAGRVSDALTLDANYVRRSDAQMRWKDG
jgi:tRNA threonylcarbamoyladenosine biosynthesis protein TsaB